MNDDLPRPNDVARGYDAAAAGYDERHGDARSVARFAIIDAPQLAAAANANRVLELGCGTGRLLAQVRAPVRIGVDISLGMLRRAPSTLTVSAADAHALPFAARSFDAIIAGKGAFRYLDAPAAFDECARVLDARGVLCVHQYAPITWTVRALARDRRLDIRRSASALAELRHTASDRGFACADTRLWRSVRVYPYALPVPTWLPGNLWSHCVMTFRKR